MKVLTASCLHRTAPSVWKDPDWDSLRKDVILKLFKPSVIHAGGFRTPPPPWGLSFHLML